MRFEQMEGVMREVLDADGEVTVLASGTSMEPFLHDGKDKVTFRKPQKPPQTGDVVFYKRKNGQFVLHRIVGKDAGGYVLRGDNQWVTEHGVREEDILAVLTRIEKNGKQYDVRGAFCRAYRVAMPAVRWGRRIKHSIEIRCR